MVPSVARGTFFRRRPAARLGGEAALAALVHGRVALVTMGPSGLGLLVARRLASAGANVILCGRNGDALDDTRAALATVGQTLHVREVNLADPAQVDALVAGVLAEHGAIDLLVNETARGIRRDLAPRGAARFDEVARAVLLEQVGALRLTTMVMRAMKRRSGGRIVHIAADENVARALPRPEELTSGPRLRLHALVLPALDLTRTGWSQVTAADARRVIATISGRVHHFGPATQRLFVRGRPSNDG